jgi:hypothetical protein
VTNDSACTSQKPAHVFGFPPRLASQVRRGCDPNPVGHWRGHFFFGLAAKRSEESSPLSASSKPASEAVSPLVAGGVSVDVPVIGVRRGVPIDSESVVGSVVRLRVVAGVDGLRILVRRLNVNITTVLPHDVCIADGRRQDHSNQQRQSSHQSSPGQSEVKEAALQRA